MVDFVKNHASLAFLYLRVGLESLNFNWLVNVADGVFFYSWSHSLGLCFLARLKPLACFISPTVIFDNAQELQKNACTGAQCGKSQGSYNVAGHPLYQVFLDCDLTWNWPTSGPSQSSLICQGSTSATDVRHCLHKWSGFVVQVFCYNWTVPSVPLLHHVLNSAYLKVSNSLMSCKIMKWYLRYRKYCKFFGVILIMINFIFWICQPRWLQPSVFVR